ncbi:MAG: PP0621 family protein [Burkholderiales bacterium]
MKFVLFAFAVLVLIFLLRSTLRGRRQPPVRPSADTAAPQAMLTCAQCGIHMPRDEALPGRGGVFCGDAHRAAFERAHPPG